MEILEMLGIRKDVPLATKHMDYTKLEGEAIRIFNRIIKYMDKNHIDDVMEFVGKKNIQNVTIVSKTKEHWIETVHRDKMRDVLRSKAIIRYGEELNDNFVEFLQVSPDHDEIIMASKFK
uniref:Uncharacterized protein n=1 Tax=Euplotes harpa TaxID=151035 RepID=A0A7S3IZZ3_9SPIT|mmetsp:Transcript_12185/g.13898  ORF Transcript_12185/g.13898 Transcript_12185/m.13898 type:complete len:120 (+) Transcript_12185:51-410(+)